MQDGDLRREQHLLVHQSDELAARQQLHHAVLQWRVLRQRPGMQRQRRLRHRVRSELQWEELRTQRLRRQLWLLQWLYHLPERSVRRKSGDLRDRLQGLLHRLRWLLRGGPELLSGRLGRQWLLRHRLFLLPGQRRLPPG
jgi:hypothetical protein